MSTGHSRARGGRGAGPTRAHALIAVIAVTASHASSVRAHPDAAGDAVEQSAAVHERVDQHSLAIGFESLFFRTHSTDDYTMQGPALVYDFFIGRRWGFLLRAAGFSALTGQMSGPTGHFDGALDQVYDQHHYGVDTMLMAAHRLPVGVHLIATVALGAHVQWFSLQGTRYSPVEDASAGLAGLVRLDYPVNGWLGVSGELAGAADPIDLINHRNPARLVLPLCLSFGVAARY